jgi:hypothetical protein
MLSKFYKPKSFCFDDCLSLCSWDDDFMITVQMKVSEVVMIVFQGDIAVK